MSSKKRSEPTSVYYIAADPNNQSTFSYGNHYNQYPGGNKYPPPDGVQYSGNRYEPKDNAHDREIAAQHVTEPGAMVMERTPAPQNWMGPAIFACLCCFWPTGLCAIAAASNANEAAAKGNILEAERESRKARMYVGASVVIGIVITIIVVVYRVVLNSKFR